MSGTFPAQYDGVCAAECGSRIHPGDIVRYEDGQLVHDECAPQPDQLEVQPYETTCPDCWMIYRTEAGHECR
ncbi:hypothetical protein [Microbacterium sp. KR10-403]|uniref:hypothetical protein n=1 Tax=Microbacterium sp. KR10-403 TaxID=3158581 RepID=UPI0032E53191